MKKTSLDLRNQRFAWWRAVVAFMIPLFVASGCKDDKVLGLELQPEGEFDPVGVLDTFTVKAFTLEGERQRSDEAQSYIGKLQSDMFGTSESALIMNFRLQVNNIYLENASSFNVDSVILHLQPTSAYGRFTDPVPVEVFEINQRIYADSAYFSDFSPRLEESAVGNYTMRLSKQISPLDSVIVDGQSKPFQFRIPLEQQLGEHLLAGLGSSYATNNSFQEYFNGLMVKVSDQMDASLDGAVYGFSLLDEQSGLSLYISTATTDTVVFYPLNNTTARINQFKHDYSNSLIQDYLNDPSTNEDLLFVQGMAGTRAEIQIPSLYTFGQEANIAINKATLSFTVADQQPDIYGNAQQLFLLDLEEGGIESLTLDYIYSPTRSGGQLDDASGTYTFDVTRHVQKVLEEAKLGNDVNYGLRLHAQVPVINGNDTTQNVVKGSDNIVLKLYHTDLKD